LKNWGRMGLKVGRRMGLKARGWVWLEISWRL